jgi:2-polyprenyl-3-methyl-5-hydroxy-6-metoxy-1,4-benzoquinol methylase
MAPGIYKQLIKDTFNYAESYHKLYNGVSPLSHLFNTRLARVYELLGSVDGLDVLDVGCGPGMPSIYIMKNGGRYFGIDLSMEMLKENRRTSAAYETHHLAQATVGEMPFPASTFDRALCLGVLEYVEDLELAFDDLSKKMRDNAIVILSMQNPFSIYRLWDRHIHPGFLFNMIRKARGRSVVGEPLEKLTSLKDLKVILARHNLIVKDAIYYNFNLWVKPLDSLFPLLSVSTSKRLEVLYRSMVGLFLGADFLILAEKVCQAF